MWEVSKHHTGSLWSNKMVISPIASHLLEMKMEREIGKGMSEEERERERRRLRRENECGEFFGVSYGGLKNKNAAKCQSLPDLRNSLGFHTR